MLMFIIIWYTSSEGPVSLFVVDFPYSSLTLARDTQGGIEK